MPKKSSKTSAETEPVVAAATTPAPVEQKAKKAKVAKTEPAPAAPVVAAPVVSEPTSTETTPDLGTPLIDQSSEFLANLQKLSAQIAALKSEFRTLEKAWSREVKTAQKVSSKRKRKAGNRAPSGFVKPTKISDELASFLGKEKGTEMARTEVTRDINTYIRNNNLQDKENGRKINPDTKLAALLKLKKTDELTYFNLQRYMSPHFAKATKDASATA